MKQACRLALIALLLTAYVPGAVLIGNLPSIGENAELSLYDYYTGSKYAAVGFQTGAAQTLLEQVTLRLWGYDLFLVGNIPGAPLVGLYSGTDTAINTLVAALNGPVNLANDQAAPQQVNYTPSVAVTLDPDSFYWLVLYGPAASSTKTSWAGTANAGATPSSGLGFTPLDYRGGGTTIANMQIQSDRYFYYQIQGSQVPTGGDGGGDPPPEETPEAATMIMIASGLLLMRFVRFGSASPA